MKTFDEFINEGKKEFDKNDRFFLVEKLFEFRLGSRIHEFKPGDFLEADRNQLRRWQNDDKLGKGTKRMVPILDLEKYREFEVDSIKNLIYTNCKKISNSKAIQYMK